MLHISHEQKLLLYEFVVEKESHNQRLGGQLERTLTYIMSKVDVRKPEQIIDESIRELVRCTFEVVKNQHLLENSLITPASYQNSISKAQARLKARFENLGI